MDKRAISYGSLIGICTVAYFSAIFFFNKGILFNTYIQAVSFVFYLFFMLLAAKSEAAGDFKVVMRLAFGTFIVGNIFYYIFDFTLFNYIDASLENLYKESVFEAYKPALKTIEEQNKLFDDIQGSQFHTFSATAFRFAKGAIGGFGLSVAVAFVIKRFFAPKSSV